VIAVDIALNDDRGQPTGHAAAMTFWFDGDPVVLNANDPDGPYCRAIEARGGGFVWVASTSYDFSSHDAWFGAAGWDRFRMRPDIAENLLQDAARSGRWSLSSGPALCWAWWAAVQESRSG